MTQYNYNDAADTRADTGLGLLAFTPEEPDLVGLVTNGSGALTNKGAFKFYYARSSTGTQSSHGKITISAGAHPYHGSNLVQTLVGCRQTSAQLGYGCYPAVNSGSASDIADCLKVIRGAAGSPGSMPQINLSPTIDMSTTAMTIEIFVAANGVDLTVIVNGTTYTVAGSGANDASGSAPLTGGTAWNGITNNSSATTGVGLIDSFDDGASTAAALAGDATAVSAASAALTTAIQNAGDAASVATGSGALTTAIQNAGDAQSIATAAGDLSTAIQLIGAAQAIATAGAGLVSWVNVTVASPYTGPGSIFDDRYWTGAAPANGDVIAYEDRGDGFVVNPNGTYSSPVFGTWLVQYFNGAWSLSEISIFQSDFFSDASAQSTASGNLLTSIQMAAAAAAVATVAAALDTGIPLGGDVQSVATAAGALLTAINLGGDAQGIATAAADLYGAAQFLGDALAQSTAAGDLSTAITLLGDAQSIASAVGDITALIQLAGDAQAQALASGSLDATAAQLQSDAQSIATAQADMSTGISLSGDSTALSVAAAALDTAINLIGAADATATADGQLAGTAAALVGAADAIATALADLTTISFISGDAVALSSAQGDLTTLGPIFADAVAAATAAADLSTAIQLLSVAMASANSSGALTTLGPVVYPPRGTAINGRRVAFGNSRRPRVLH